MKGGFTALALVLGLLVLLAAAPLRAEVAEPGVRYPEGTYVEVPQLGFALSVPTGWVGILPRVGKNFVLGSPKESGMIVISVKSDVTLESLEAEFSRPIRLDAKTTLRPRGKPSIEGETVKGSFTARVSGATVVGYGEAYLVRSPGAMRLIGLGPPDRADRMVGMIATVRGSVRELNPETPPQDMGADAPG